MNTKTIITVVIILVVVLVGWGIYQSGKNTQTVTEPTPTVVDSDGDNDGDVSGMDDATTTPTVTASTTVDVSVGVGPVKTFTVTGSNFSFTPKTLSVNKGDKVKIIFKNSDGTHDFKIDEFGVASAKIQGGAETAVEFTADKVGSFQYYCSIGSHRAMGMWGTLTVK